jgi:hypothetical protein
MLSRERGEGFSLAEWDFYGNFGALSDVIVPTFEAAIEEYLTEETPFYFVVPALEGDPTVEEAYKPLDFFLSFGFGENRDAYVYKSSIDARVAMEFDMRRRYADNAYVMTAAEIESFKGFSAALRELADKMDVELAKVILQPEEDDTNVG